MWISATSLLTCEGYWPWIKEDHMGKEQGSDVLGLRGRWWKESRSKKRLASEVQAKHCRLPPDLGKQAFGLQKLGLQVLSCIPNAMAPGREPAECETEAVCLAWKSRQSDRPSSTLAMPAPSWGCRCVAETSLHFKVGT